MQFETQRLIKNGQLVDVPITASPVKDATGRIIGVSKVARDKRLLITIQKMPISSI